MRNHETIELPLETYNELLKIEDKYLEIKNIVFDDNECDEKINIIRQLLKT